MYKFFYALILGTSILLPAAEWKMTRQELETDFSRRIVPQVQSAELTGQYTTVAPGVPIRTGEDGRTAARLLAEQLERNGRSVGRGEVIEVELSVNPDDEKPEGYRIAISKQQIEIRGNSPRGLLFGVQSLRQLLQPTDDGVSKLPIGIITDWPDLAWRGIFTSGLAPKAERDNLAELFSLLKLNFMIIRVDQWLKYDRFPSLAHKQAAWEKKEYRDYVRLGRTLGLEMIPNSSLYSHFAWALWGEYGYLMEVPQTAISNFSTPDIEHPDTPGLIRGIMEEVCEAFDSPRYYHVGQDELKFAPRLPTEKDKRSCREKFALALKLLKKNCDDLGVRMMMWADQMLESRTGGAPENTYLLRRELPRDVILADFTYFSAGGFEQISELAKEGFEVLGTSWYDTDCIGEYCEVLRKTPGALGMINSMWGGMNIYGTVPEHQAALVWAAENSWSVDLPRYESYRNFPTDTFYFLFNLRQPLVRRYMPLDLTRVARTPLGGKNAMSGGENSPDFSGMPPMLNRRDFTFELSDGKCLLLGGGADLLPKEAVLKFGPQKADSIAFAHVTGLPELRALAFTNLDNKRLHDPGLIAVYTVTYDDGDSVEIPITYTREITDWNEPAGSAQAPVVWDGRTPDGKLARVFGYRWRNPYPDKAVCGIRLTAGKSSLPLAVVGISLERTQEKEQ